MKRLSPLAACSVLAFGLGLMSAPALAQEAPPLPSGRSVELPPPSREGSDALVGRSALVTREVTADGGLVHLSGEDWSARAFDEDLVIPPGVRVDVFGIEGATAVVHPRDPLPDPLREPDPLEE